MSNGLIRGITFSKINPRITSSSHLAHTTNTSAIGELVILIGGRGGGRREEGKLNYTIFIHTHMVRSCILEFILQTGIEYIPGFCSVESEGLSVWIAHGPCLHAARVTAMVGLRQAKTSHQFPTSWGREQSSNRLPPFSSFSLEAY